MQLKRYAAGTDLGLQRSNNEDSFLCNDGLHLWAVADGMGGHAAGEVASEITSKTLCREIANGESLADAIQRAHHEILIAAANGIGGQGMGSTVVALSCDSGNYQVAWVGDSRAYLWSPSSEVKLKQLSRDHSYVQMLFESGAIGEEELATHPEKNIITQCLGSIDLDNVQVDITEGQWKDDEMILLCSDGLSDFVPLTEMTKIIDSSPAIDEAVKSLIRKALDQGGRDNITVVLVRAPDKWAILRQKINRVMRRIFR